MIFTTIKSETLGYVWNTGHGLELEENVFLSDYSELYDELDRQTIEKTLERVFELNVNLVMNSPMLVTVISGDSKSCRLWIDKSQLKERRDILDPKKESGFYSDQ